MGHITLQLASSLTGLDAVSLNVQITHFLLWYNLIQSYRKLSIQWYFLLWWAFSVMYFIITNRLPLEYADVNFKFENLGAFANTVVNAVGIYFLKTQEEMLVGQIRKELKKNVNSIICKQLFNLLIWSCQPIHMTLANKKKVEFDLKMKHVFNEFECTITDQLCGILYFSSLWSSYFTNGFWAHIVILVEEQSNHYIYLFTTWT